MVMKAGIIALLVCVAWTKSDDATCGYSSCNLGKDGMLNVHLVPHTHDDVGWQKTVDHYYYGARSDIRNAGVQYILDTVIEQLSKDPSKRFIYVEQAFFYRWWREQQDYTRHLVKRLVNTGQLEFILGGWSMNDEAATHYNAIIDQHTVGFKFLRETFGDCAIPKIGWQIDPFGHSREQASIFAQFGFDGLFFGRLDYQDKAQRLNSKTMEMVWLGSDSLGDQASLFTGVNFNGYGPPDGFCFDEVCSDPPIMDDPRLEDYNVDERINKFINACNEQSEGYSTNHIMLTMGSDFHYQNARQNFKNLDKLIKYTNARQSNGSRINAFYSTPSCYLYALNKANQTYTSKHDDFFPYASRAHTFWTGYFTSRPALKGYVRHGNNVLQVCKQLDVLAQISVRNSTKSQIDTLRQAMGLLQHHDAVSGTEQQHVSDDYAKQLAVGLNQCQSVIDTAYSQLLPKSSNNRRKSKQPPSNTREPNLNSAPHPAPTQTPCLLLNVSRCQISESNPRFTVTVYNPIGRSLRHYVRVPVSGSTYAVAGPTAMLVDTQLVPLSAETKSLPAFNGSRAQAELVFPVDLPPLGFSTYFVQKSAETSPQATSSYHVPAQDTVIKNSELSLTFDGTTGLLKSIQVPFQSINVPVKQSLMYYTAMAGDCKKPEHQASGAYVFRPANNTPFVINENPKTSVVTGPLVQEVHQVFGDWASQVFRLYKDSPYVEIEWTIGPIPYKDKIGKEVISRFETNLETGATFYTDANGRELLKRVHDYRPTWKLNQTEEVAGNYYPVNSRIAIIDKKKDIQLTVLTDRSQGGASIKDGQMELMLHRRLFYDDTLGVKEPLNETGISGHGLVVRGRQLLSINRTAAAAAMHRDAGERIMLQPYITFHPLSMDTGGYIKAFNTQWSGLTEELPSNVHLLTLEEFTADTYLLRLENFYAKNETDSKKVTVSLQNLFRPFTVTNVTELTLGGNQQLNSASRLRWNVKGYGTTTADMAAFAGRIDPTNWTIDLKPMQIRTFQITIKPKYTGGKE